MSPRLLAHKEKLHRRAAAALDCASQCRNSADVPGAEQALAEARRDLSGLEFLHGAEAVKWATGLIDAIEVGLAATGLIDARAVLRRLAAARAKGSA